MKTEKVSNLLQTSRKRLNFNSNNHRIGIDIYPYASRPSIHSDLRDSCNIIKKVIPEAFDNRIEDIGILPRHVSNGQMITSKGGC